MRKFSLAATLGLMPLAFTAASAQDAPAKPSTTSPSHSAREAVRQISLSPDGTKVAIVQPTKGRGSALMTRLFVPEPSPARISPRARRDWASS